MSSETSNSSLGKAGAETVMTAAKVLQDVFNPEGKNELPGAYEPSPDSPTLKGRGSSSYDKERRLKQLPKSVQKEVLKISEQVSEFVKEGAEKTEKEVKKLSSLDFRKGFAIGVNLAKSPDIRSDELSVVFRDILKAQPRNEYLQGLFKGSLHQERIMELNSLKKSKSRSRGMER